MSFGLSASISVHGISRLGLRSYPTGSSVRETTTTIFSFKDDHSDSPMVPKLNTTVYGTTSNPTIPSGSVVPTRVHLGRKVIPSACMEAVMQHFQAVGFSEEVSRAVGPV